jgi:Protein kinase domain
VSVTERSHEGVLGPGMTVGEFVIEAVAGRGGMGIVYRARQREPDRVVALKVIAPDLAGDACFEARFKSEGRIAARIEHPNVIPIYSVGEDRGTLYIAMRFVVGTDLRAVIEEEEGRIEPGRAAVLIDQVARALDAAHGHGLVHRDVKPANILLAAQAGREHAYLTDFGLSRLVADSQAITATGALVGTVDYIAPEQVRGERVDARTDVYSLGCVLFHSLTGRVPYPEGNQIAKLYAHDSRPPPLALECVPELPPALDGVIARAMAKDPDARYQSAGDLGAAALAAVDLASSPHVERTVAAGTAARLGAPTTPAASRRRVFAAAAALVVLLALAAVVILSQSGSVRKANRGEASNARTSPAQRLLALIPPVTRESCKPAAQGVPDPSATASLECGLPGLDVVYLQFPNNTVMNQWYALTRENSGLSPASGSCTASAFHGESRLTVMGTSRGRYLCLLDGGKPRLYQTDERFGVGIALDYYRGTGRPAIQSLLRQWRCCTTLGAS